MVMVDSQGRVETHDGMDGQQNIQEEEELGGLNILPQQLLNSSTAGWVSHTIFEGILRH